MPTAGSWTERNRHLRAVADVGHLVRFRASAVRRRAAFVWGAGAAGPGHGRRGRGAGVHAGRRRQRPGVRHPAAAADRARPVSSPSASCRPRRPAAAASCSAATRRAVFPISPTTDHLGALLLSPLNIAWLLQAWTLLGTTAYALGHDLRLASAQIVVLLWIATATAISQAVAWGLESARRVPHGVVGIRALVVGLLGAVLGLQVSGNLLDLFDRIPTRQVVIGMVTGFDLRWLQTSAC